MRTKEQMLSRRKATRMVSGALILVGALKLGSLVIGRADLPTPAFFDQLEVAALFFLTAGAFVGLSRIWGELADGRSPS